MAVRLDTRGCVLRKDIPIGMEFFLHPSWPRIRQICPVLWLDDVPVGVEGFGAPEYVQSERDLLRMNRELRESITIIASPIEEPRGMEFVVRVSLPGLPEGCADVRGRAFRPCDRHGDREIFFEVFSVPVRLSVVK